MSRFRYLLFILIILTFITSPVYAANEPMVAVLPFDEGDLSWKGIKADDILNGITQQVTDKLVQRDGIRVIERTRIEEILTEQDFGYSGRVDPATAARIGRILGVDALILGTLTTLNVHEQGGISIGPLSITGIKAEVVLSGRVVVVETAEIIDSFTGSGESSNASISINDLEGLSFGTKAFADSILGQSIDQATTSFVNSIEPDKMRGQSAAAWYVSGEVLKILGDKLIIDIGQNLGLFKGQVGELIRLVEVEGLSEPVEMPIGRVQVFSVDRRASVVKVLELYDSESARKGDFVRFDI